jgi:hypothetical protein
LAAIRGVPALGEPNITMVVGARVWPNALAPTAWSTLAKIISSRLANSSSTSARVVVKSLALRTVTRPSSAMGSSSALQAAQLRAASLQPIVGNAFTRP